ncbi:hypothetical protein CPLU01_09642 [Colletotrichum plurivorum]|uniref:Uncharacterized protein n=1 Tax=Colletotrichum plurivorum TaxID=2175906 RepID=A0A8H6K8K2_9PEZI|nr:hypothetical protein CPLU01_09642 [Colletotrichum plurivorum]
MKMRPADVVSPKGEGGPTGRPALVGSPTCSDSMSEFALACSPLRCELHTTDAAPLSLPPPRQAGLHGSSSANQGNLVPAEGETGGGWGQWRGRPQGRRGGAFVLFDRSNKR